MKIIKALGLIVIILTTNPLIYSQNTLISSKEEIVPASEKNKLLTNRMSGPLSSTPFSFYKNAGQWDNAILYQFQANGISARFMQNGISFVSGREKEQNNFNDQVDVKNNSSYEYIVWNLNFLHTKNDIKLIAENLKQGVSNYLKSADPAKWIIAVSESNGLIYKDIYDNIDLKYYEAFNTLKYDYVLNPGAKMENIQMQFNGIKKIKINEKGNLEIYLPWGMIEEDKPFAYQFIHKKREQVDVQYILINDSTFSFKAYEKYDLSQQLIIDPLGLKWSTHLKCTANNTANYSYDIASDANGDIYITGKCDASLPITPGIYQPGYGGGTSDAFVAKLDRNGTSMLFCTYIGGSGDDIGLGITTDVSGAYITGSTFSFGTNDFPCTSNAFQTIFRGNKDAFITKINLSGNALIYSTLIGGTGSDIGEDIVVSNEEAYITGESFSSDFPVSTNAFQPLLGGSAFTYDAFVSKLNTTGTSLVYSTYMGGIGGDYGVSIAINNGQAYITGTTGSNNFPVSPGVFQPSFKGGASDAFITCLNTTGTGLIYSTYLGSSGPHDLGQAIDVNNAGEVYITGYSFAPTDFPLTSGAYQTLSKGINDAFVTKLNAAGSALIYSTLLSGSFGDFGYGIKANCSGEAYVTGTSNSPDFPVMGAFQSAHHGSDDFFISVLDATGSSLISSTYMGGNREDYSTPHLILNETCTADTLIISGTTHSTDFPTPVPGVYEPNKINGTGDQPVVFKMYRDKLILTAYNDATICSGSSVNLSATGGTNFSWVPVAGLNSTTVSNPAASPTVTTTYYVSTDCIACMDSVIITVNPSPVINIMGNNNLCAGDSTLLTASGASGYIWLPLIGIETGTTAIVNAKPASTITYTVTGIGGNGCSSQSVFTISITVYPLAEAGPNDTICQGEDAVLIASGGNSFLWNTGAPTAIINISPSSTTTYTVNVFNGNCADMDTTKVIVYPPPIADAGNNISITIGTTALLTGSGSSLYYWTPATGLSCVTCQNPVASPLTTTIYYLTVTDNNGCTSMDSVIVTVEIACGAFFVPTAFSPNEDINNDMLCLYGASCIKSLTFIIYNRWGEKVFETTDPKICWDGMYNIKNRNEAVFMYYLNATLQNKEVVIKKGTITLIK